jgi:hypothetical protein
MNALKTNKLSICRRSLEMACFDEVMVHHKKYDGLTNEKRNRYLIKNIVQFFFSHIISTDMQFKTLKGQFLFLF